MSEQGEGSSVPTFQKTKVTPSFFALLLRSLALLGFLALIFVGIYWIFGRVAFEDLSKAELYGQVMRGQADVRRMAALEWATKLQSADSGQNLKDLREFLPTEEESAVLSQELKSLETAARPDVDLISGVLAVLGHSYSARAQESLIAFLSVPRQPDWSRAEVQAIIALARRSPDDAEVLEIFNKRLQTTTDASVKKAIAYALGFEGEGEPGEEVWTQKKAMLETLIQDELPDVRWNAAFSAIRLNLDLDSAHQLLNRLMNELYADFYPSGRKLTQEREVSLGQKRETYLQALKLIDRIPNTSPVFETIKKLVFEIADKHPDLKIRQAAKNALKPRD